MKKKKRVTKRYVHVYGSNDGTAAFPISVNHPLKDSPILIMIDQLTCAQIMITTGTKVQVPKIDYDDDF